MCDGFNGQVKGKRSDQIKERMALMLDFELFVKLSFLHDFKIEIKKISFISWIVNGFKSVILYLILLILYGLLGGEGEV